MSVETKASLVKVSAKPEEPPLKRAPTLYVIIFFKLAKGILACIFAVVLYFQSAAKLGPEYQHLMAQEWVGNTFSYLRIHPENKFFTRIATDLENVTDAGVREAALGALLWSLFPLTEGLGMLFRAGWAGWLAILESAFFVPLEVHKLLEKFTWFMVIVTLTNIGIVWYLYAFRASLFHHHHSPDPDRVDP